MHLFWSGQLIVILIMFSQRIFKEVYHCLQPHQSFCRTKKFIVINRVACIKSLFIDMNILENCLRVIIYMLCRDESGELCVGIRHARKPQNLLSSSITKHGDWCACCSISFYHHSDHIWCDILAQVSLALLIICLKCVQSSL